METPWPQLYDILRSEADRQGIGLSKIILFGSRARGTHQPHSDWDLLLITDTPLDPATKKHLYLACQRRLGLPMDLFIYDPNDIRLHKDNVGNIAYYALREGQELQADGLFTFSLNHLYTPGSQSSSVNKQTAQQWLSFAESDLKIAKKELNDSEPFFHAVCFHAQQCAEKALKAFLILHDKPLQKTHDLEALVRDCVEIEPAFQTLLQENLSQLNPYATQVRYPNGLLAPSKEEAEEAVQKAQQVLRVVLACFY